MNATLQTRVTAPPDDSQGRESRPANRRNDDSLFERQASLQRAVLTLRAIRQRYETGRDAHPEARRYSEHVVVDISDMAWITAAIEILERTIITRALDAAGPTAQARSQPSSSSPG